MLKKLSITFTFFILIAGCSGGDKSPVDSGLENGYFILEMVLSRKE